MIIRSGRTDILTGISYFRRRHAALKRGDALWVSGWLSPAPPGEKHRKKENEFQHRDTKEFILIYSQRDTHSLKFSRPCLRRKPEGLCFKESSRPTTSSLSFHVICWQEGKYNKNNSKLMWQQILISCHNRITSLLPAGSVRLQVSVTIRRLKCLDVQMLPAAVSLLTCLLRSGFTASWHLSRPQGEPSLDPISQTCC